MPVQPEASRAPRRHPDLSAVRVTFEGDGNGGGRLSLSYAGPLISYEPIWVRLGERRLGKDWVRTRDLPMQRSDGSARVEVAVSAGEAIEGFTFAFFTSRGSGIQEIWDNAGKPYGCYVFDAKTGRVSAR